MIPLMPKGLLLPSGGERTHSGNSAMEASRFLTGFFTRSTLGKELAERFIEPWKNLSLERLRAIYESIPYPPKTTPQAAQYIAVTKILRERGMLDLNAADEKFSWDTIVKKSVSNANIKLDDETVKTRDFIARILQGVIEAKERTEHPY